MKLTQLAKTVIFFISLVLFTNPLSAQEAKFYPMGRLYTDIQVSPNDRYIAASVTLPDRADSEKYVQIIDSETNELISILDKENSLNDILFESTWKNKLSQMQQFTFSDDSKYLYTYSSKKTYAGSQAGEIVKVGKWDIFTGQEIENKQIYTWNIGETTHFEVHDDTLFVTPDFLANSIDVIPLNNPDSKIRIKTGRIGCFQVIPKYKKILCMKSTADSLLLFDYQGNLQYVYDLKQLIPGFIAEDYSLSTTSSFVRSDCSVYLQGLYNIKTSDTPILRVETEGKYDVKLFTSLPLGKSIKSFDISLDGTKIIIPIGKDSISDQAILEIDTNFKDKKVYDIPKQDHFLQSSFYTKNGIVGHSENGLFFYAKNENDNYLGMFPINHCSSLYVTNDDKYLIGTEINGYTTEDNPIERSIYVIYDIKARKVISTMSIDSTDVSNRLSAYHTEYSTLFIPFQNDILSYSIPDFKPLNKYSGHSAHVTSVSISTDSTRLISTSEDSTLIVREIFKGDIIFSKKLERRVDNAIHLGGSKILYFCWNSDGYHHGKILDIDDESIEETPVLVDNYLQYSSVINYLQYNAISYDVKSQKTYYIKAEVENQKAVSAFYSYDFSSKIKKREYSYPGGFESSNVAIANSEGSFCLANSHLAEELFLYDLSNDKVSFVLNEEKLPEAIFDTCKIKYYPYRAASAFSIAMDSKAKNIYFTTKRGALGIVDISAITSVNEQTGSKINLTVYPNPVSNGTLSIDLDQAEEIKTVQIFNYMGELVANFPEMENTYSKNLQLQIGNYPSGAYVIRINCKDKPISKNIIVE